MQNIVKKGFSYSFNPDACRECGGKCCRGASGYVWVDNNAQEKIANFLNIEKIDFLIKYTRSAGLKISLIENKIGYNDYSCIFFDIDKKICKIYEARPNQCKTFPFWENIEEKRIKEVSKECMGIIQN